MRCNAGSVTNLSGTLQSLSPDLEVLQANAGFGNLSLGDSARNTSSQFVLRASSSAGIEVPIWCNLYLTGNSGFADTLRVPILVGDSVNEPLGPDAYGYQAYDNQDVTYSEHPAYDWVDIRDVGNKLTLGDDDTRTIELPPEFGPIYYYGQRTTRLSVCSNGWVAPDTSTRLDFNDIPLPDPYAPQRIIALLWDNFDPTAFGWIGWFLDTANHRLVVQFDSVPYFPQHQQWETFEIIFYDTTLAGPTGDNVFVVQYATANNISSTTSGIQNNDATAGMTYLHNMSYPRQAAAIVPGRAVKYQAQALSGVRDRGSGIRGRATIELSCWPNPVRDRAEIDYSMGAPGQVRAGIFDAAGRSVQTLVSGYRPAGRYQMTWSPAVTPGVYFCRVMTGQGEAVRRIVVAR